MININDDIYIQDSFILSKYASLSSSSHKNSYQPSIYQINIQKHNFYYNYHNQVIFIISSKFSLCEANIEPNIDSNMHWLTYNIHQPIRHIIEGVKQNYEPCSLTLKQYLLHFQVSLFLVSNKPTKDKINTRTNTT